MSNKACAYTCEEIQRILPHRYPFMLIDRVIEVTESPTGDRVGRKCRAVKNVTFNEPYFQGHFPGLSIMPGVLIVEAMAQAGGMASYIPGDQPLHLVLARFEGVRFRKPVVPGDQLILTAEVIRDRGRLIMLRGEAFVDDQLVAEAEILAHVTFQQ